MKVLQFSGLINRDDAIDAIVRYLCNETIQIHVATLTPKSPIADTEYDIIGIPHYKLSSKTSHSYLDYILSIPKLFSIIRRHKIDIIHAHLFWVTIIATVTKFLVNILNKKKIKLIIHRHYTHDIDYLRGYKKFILKFLEFISYRYADLIIVPTTSINKIIASEYDDYVLEKVKKIPHCFKFDANKYNMLSRDERLEFRRKMGAEDAFVIVNVGSQRWQKGQHVLIKSFADLLKVVPNAQLWLVGSGPDTDKLKHLASSLGLLDGDKGPCKFWGFRPADQVRLFIGAADLFVHPTFSEAFPQVMVETLVLGTPLIITPVSGAVDHLEHKKHAWFVPINELIA